MGRPAAVVLLALAAGVACACAGPTDHLTYVPNPPSRDTFQPVSDALEVHCGTLDCHGSSWRNMRVYGIDGQRLDPHGITGNKATTEAEYTATYEAVIAVQPEVLSHLVNDHGANPERWIVITKGRGTEVHKGNSQMKAGDATDTCIISWVAGALNQEACDQAASISPPDPNF
jgi:hypothetical protein